MVSKRNPPQAHTWAEGGGVVVRCDDPEIARPLMVAAYLDSDYVDAEDIDVEELFPVEKAAVERGRKLGALPGSYAEAEGWSWMWWPHTGGSTRGTTMGVTWGADR